MVEGARPRSSTSTTAPIRSSRRPTPRRAVPARVRGSTRYITRVIGVTKAYTTRVGAGPFPTELFDGVGDLLVERPTSSARTPGGAAARAGRRRHAPPRGPAQLAVGARRDEARHARHAGHREGVRRLRARGREARSMPYHQSVFHDVTPVYVELPGWQTDLSVCTEVATCPRGGHYLELIEREVGVPVRLAAPARAATSTSSLDRVMGSASSARAGESTRWPTSSAARPRSS